MRKTLCIASTPYQLLVLLFIKNAYLKDATVDLVITDKTPSMVELFESKRLEKVFSKVYFADARKIKNPYKNALVTLWESFIYNKTTDEIIDKPLDIYDECFYASPGIPDEVVKEIAKTLIKKNRKILFHRYEDGFASYTKIPSHVVNTPLGMKLYKSLFRYDLSKMEKNLYVFEPEMIESVSDFTPIKIEKTEESIKSVINLAKELFDFKSNPPKANTIFLGQGTRNGMGNDKTYQGIIRKLSGMVADKSSLDNFCIKPHPRGEFDDFGNEFFVYKDSCPMELSIANGDMEEKTLISFYSTACVSGKLLFNSKCKIIFLYPLCEDSFNEKCDYEHYFNTFKKLYSNVYIANSYEKLKEYL